MERLLVLREVRRDIGDLCLPNFPDIQALATDLAKSKAQEEELEARCKHLEDDGFRGSRDFSKFDANSEYCVYCAESSHKGAGRPVRLLVFSA